jgi:ribose transport system permease protein
MPNEQGRVPDSTPAPSAALAPSSAFAPPRTGRRRGLRRLPRPRFFAIWLVTAALFAISPLLASGSLSGSSLLTVLPFTGVLAIATIGQTLVIQQGGLDLSVPGGISLGAVMVTKYAGGGGNLVFYIVLALLVGAAAGTVSGLAITWFRVTPLVATLAVNALLYGVVLSLTNGQSAQTVPSGLASFCVGRTLGIPNLALVAAAAVAIVHVAIAVTAPGRRFVAIGESARAARAAGMRVVRYQVATYALAGLCYAAAGVLLAGYLKTPNLLVGDQYLLPTVAAVVLGGTSLLGGSGSIVASAIGALFLMQLQQVLLGMGAAASVQNIVQASIIAAGMAVRLLPGVRLRRRRAATPPTAPEAAPSGD